MLDWLLVMEDQGWSDFLAWLGKEYGNLASVAGLVLSIVALVLTIFTFRRAVAAKEFAQQAVARIGSRMLSAESAGLRQFALHDRDAGAATYVPRAFDRGHERPD